MAIAFSTQIIFVCGLIVVMIVAVQTKTQFRSRNRILSSDNATTKLYPFHTKVQELLPLSTTKPTASAMSSQQIKRSKSRQQMASSNKKRRFRTHRNNYPSKLNFSSTEALKREPKFEVTTLGLASSIDTSSLSSGWPQLKDVMVTSKIHKPRHLYKTNSLVESSKSLNAKSRKRLKRRRRILERKVHNRTRKLIKQKLRIKSRMKNNSKLRQILQKKEGHQLPKNIVNSHVVSTTTKKASSSTVSHKPKTKLDLSSFSRNKSRKSVNKSRNTKNSSSVQKEKLKSQQVHSHSSYKPTTTAKTINQDISESNDSMLADEAPHILSGLEPEVSMMDYAWNEDKIEIDFKTVDDLRRLIEKAGGKFEGNLYSESVTMVASMESAGQVAISITSSSTPEQGNKNASSKTTSANNKASSSVMTSFVPNGMISSSSSSSVPIPFSTSLPNTETTVMRSSTPDPPITLSLGSWQITEEDLPLYAGLASGILLLIIVIMTVTTWRICHAQRRRTKNRTKKGRKVDSSSLSSRHSSSSDGSNQFSMGDVSHTKAVSSNKGLMMMSDAYELQVDNNGVSMSHNNSGSNSNNDHQMMEKIPPSQAKLDSFSSENNVANETIKSTKNIISPSKGHDSMVCLTKGKGSGGAHQNIESSIVNGNNSANTARKFTPQNNTFSSPTSQDRGKETMNSKSGAQQAMCLAESSYLDESGSYCCDANSQLLGGAMVASLLTGGTSPSPIRPPLSGLPNTTTTFEVECSDRVTSSGASSGGGTTAGTVSSGESRSGNSTTNGVAGSLELDIEQFTDYTDSRGFSGNSGTYQEPSHSLQISQNIGADGSKTYVRVTPVDSFSPFADYPLNHQMISTHNSAIQSGFHTFHPKGGSRTAIRTDGSGNGRGPGSSPDSIGAGDTLTGCVSTPSSEALDQVSDLRYSRTLPKRVGGIVSNNDNASSNGTKENYTFLNNNNYNNKAIPNSAASVLNGNLGSSTRSSNRIVEDLYAKVDYQTKAKNRSRGGEPFSNVASNKSNSTVINGSGTSSHGDFNGPINHIAIVPPLMKSTVIPSNHQQQQQRTSLPLQPSSTPHNMSLPLTSTSSSSACQFGLDGEKIGFSYNTMKTFSNTVANYNKENVMINSMMNPKLSTTGVSNVTGVNGNIMTASTVITSLDEECTTIPVSQLMLESNDHELYKDFSKGKTSEIHLTSSEVRAGSKIESSLLYEQPLLGLEETQKMMGNCSDGIDISGPSTTTANSVEDCNDANSSFSSGETTGGGGGPTRTNL